MEDFGSLIFVILSLAYVVVLIAGQWKVFEKAGYEGWKSLIPIYNSYCLCEIVFGNGIYVIGLFIPVVQGLFLIFLLYKLCQVFGKDTLFFLGMVFLTPIFMFLLGSGDDQYQGPTELSL
ncbi:MAG: DUF5684 domain-containing protein [Peptostreptococcaceae bacterium]|nr:DUF5684 domain-containing protein [Peptostreptococcaceae bacterium]